MTVTNCSRYTPHLFVFHHFAPLGKLPPCIQPKQGVPPANYAERGADSASTSHLVAGPANTLELGSTIERGFRLYEEEGGVATQSHV